MKGRDEAKRLLEGADLLFTQAQVEAAVTRMAGEITASLGEAFPILLSVMGGAAVFTGQLLPQLRFPLEFGAIEVTRYNNDIQGREITWRLPPRDNVRDRVVLVSTTSSTRASRWPPSRSASSRWGRARS